MYFYDLCRTLKFDGFLGELYELWIRKVVKFTEIFSVNIFEFLIVKQPAPGFKFI